MIGQYDVAPTLLDYVGLKQIPLEDSPGRSFTPALRGVDAPIERAVYFEQEETRGIRTARFSYWKRLAGTGEAELYDVHRDPQQRRNLIDDPDYASHIMELDRQLVSFFKRYSAREYDLWRGGVAKGSVARPEMFQALYGNQWAPVTQVKPVFSH